MNIELSYTAHSDIEWWNNNAPAKTDKIYRLLQNIMQTPFTVIGKPEPLTHALRGYWSRRIDHEHRLIYKVVDDTIYVASCRFHYES